VQQLGAAVQGIEAALAGPFGVASLQEHDAATAGRRAAVAAGAVAAGAAVAGGSGGVA
jgi:carbamoyl-phosphate synthase large subunit